LGRIVVEKPKLLMLGISINLAELLRDQYEFPFVFLSSYADKATLERDKRTLPMGYLVKPYSEKDLFAALEVALFNFAHLRYPIVLDFEKFNANRISKLTLKEFELLKDMYEGRTNQQLCERHFISLITVKTHVKHLYEKLGVQSCAELMVLLREG
jgi:two-component system, response regulator PdtaR